jgi:hypothetical protein
MAHEMVKFKKNPVYCLRGSFSLKVVYTIIKAAIPAAWGFAVELQV